MQLMETDGVMEIEVMKVQLTETLRKLIRLID